jgi:hypothetical protein
MPAAHTQICITHEREGLHPKLSSPRISVTQIGPLNT